MRGYYWFAPAGAVSFVFAAALLGGCGGPGARCGDGICNGSETAATCGLDCGGGTCGNGVCDAGETMATCPGDCGGPGCGNGTLDAGEECEGGALGGQTCVSQGFSGGTLACTAGCTFDTSGCTSSGPDLIVYASGLCLDMGITRNYTPNSCERAQACAPATGTIDTLEFTLVSENIGTETLYFGSPNTAALWEPVPGCPYNQFWDYATYWICPSTVADCANAAAADQVASGWKGSFCFIENFGDAPDWTGANAACGMYNCGNMGQQPGCADDYYVGLDCQWTNITGVPDGSYTLCAHIDPLDMIPEISEANNIACASITISGTATTCVEQCNFQSC